MAKKAKNIRVEKEEELERLLAAKDAMKEADKNMRITKEAVKTTCQMLEWTEQGEGRLGTLLVGLCGCCVLLQFKTGAKGNTRPRSVLLANVVRGKREKNRT